MGYQIVPLHPEHLDKLIEGSTFTSLAAQLRAAYLSPGSVAYCLLDDEVPVFAGGIVDLHWMRGEAWILPTPFFRSHVKTCLRALRDYLPRMASERGFVRVQATCVEGCSAKLFRHLGFHYEGTLAKFGPSGETCSMHARIFEVNP